MIMADLEEREAALAYMKVVRQHARAGRIPHLITGPLEKNPRHADVFFPELLGYADTPNLSSDVYRLCLAYSEAGLLPPDRLAPFAGQVTETYRKLAAKLRPVQRDTGVAWMWEEPYTDWLVEAGLLLDLLGYFPAQSVVTDKVRYLSHI